MFLFSAILWSIEFNAANGTAIETGDYDIIEDYKGEAYGELRFKGEGACGDSGRRRITKNKKPGARAEKEGMVLGLEFK